MLLSEIVGKRMVGLEDAQELGYVEGAYVHMSTLSPRFLALDSGKVVSVEKIFSVGEVITTLEYENESIPLNEYFKITIRQEVILVSGERIGKVKDMLILGRGKNSELECDKGKIKLKSITSISENIIVANPTYRVLKLKTKAPKNELLQLNASTPERNDLGDGDILTPPSYDFLIGKKVNSEVSDINRSFVLMAGTIITKKVIGNAIKAGKLTDLVNKSR